MLSMGGLTAARWAGGPLMFVVPSTCYFDCVFVLCLQEILVCLVDLSENIA